MHFFQRKKKKVDITVIFFVSVCQVLVPGFILQVLLYLLVNILVIDIISQFDIYILRIPSIPVDPKSHALDIFKWDAQIKPKG